MELYAALLGAVIGGGLTMLASLHLFRLERSHRRLAVAAAISTEIGTLVRLVVQRDYVDELRRLAAVTSSQKEKEAPPRFEAPLGQDNFVVFEANAAVIGELPTKNVVEIITFYQQARSFVASAAFISGRALVGDEWRAIAAYYTQMADHLDRLIQFGDRLAAEIAPMSASKFIFACERFFDLSVPGVKIRRVDGAEGPQVQD